MNDIINLEHPNITKYEAYHEDPHHIFVLQEFCIGGRLVPKIEALTEMSENMAAVIIEQILKSVQYLNSKDLIYCGIKPGVLLLETKEDI